MVLSCPNQTYVQQEEQRVYCPGARQTLCVCVIGERAAAVLLPEAKDRDEVGARDIVFISTIIAGIERLQIRESGRELRGEQLDKPYVVICCWWW